MNLLSFYLSTPVSSLSPRFTPIQVSLRRSRSYGGQAGFSLLLLPLFLVMIHLWVGSAAAANSTNFNLGKRPYPPGTRDQWISAGRVLGSAPKYSKRSSKSTKGAANNSSNLPPVGAQGAENSCVFWSGAYVKTATMKHLDPSLDINSLSNQCSPRFCYNLSNGGTDVGGYGHEPYEIFMRYGAPSWQQVPYIDGQYTNLPVIADFLEGLHRRSTNYVWLWAWNPGAAQIAELKQLLDDGGVASCGVDADASFRALTALDPPWIGPVCTSAQLNHMVTVCGYSTNWYLVANSWGTNWGSNGFTHVDANYFEHYFGDIFYPLEGNYTPATNYVTVQCAHARRSDLQTMELLVNSSVARSFSPTPKDMPTNSGLFLTDNRDDLNVAVDLSLANWDVSSNLVTVRIGDRKSGTAGAMQNFTVVYNGTTYSSTTTPVNIPDLSGYGVSDILLFRLDTESGMNGSVSVGAQWTLAGITTNITAIPAQYYHFTNWAGNITGDAIYTNPLALVMDQPKAVTGYFTANLTTNTSTPEAWLAYYGYTNFAEDALRDPSGKGMTLWQEYIAGTDPSNVQDLFVIKSATNEAGSLALTFFGRTGRLYSARCETNLAIGQGWEILGSHSNITGSNAVIEITDPDSLPTSRFYRIGVRLQD